MSDARTTAEIESLFRAESTRLISVLTRIFGPRNLELAEDVMQESFAAALDTWSTRGVPDNPSAWLLTTARNRAIDAIRRERTRRRFADDMATYLDSEWTLSFTVDEAFGEELVRDDQLRMIFMCCHRSVSPENQVTLILKTLCGLSVPAIARALLTTESTINKRLYRTRRALEGVEFVLPTEDELPSALLTAHTAIYLLFNEGYLSTDDKPILRDVCRDAMHMAELLVSEPSLASSDSVALLSLMCFNAARLDARIDEQGRLVPLDAQDRSLYDADLIARGFRYLGQSSVMERVTASRFHLEAAIAARHCQANTFDETDWDSICRLYDRLQEVAPSPMVELNRAVAISYRDDPQTALPLVEAMYQANRLPHSHLVVAVLANLYARAGSTEPTRAFLDEALRGARSPHERQLIELQARRAQAAAAFAGAAPEPSAGLPTA